METIGQEIKRIRERAGMGPIEFSRVVGISRQTLRRIESHGDLPTLRILHAIADALGLRLSVKFTRVRQ